MSRRCVTLTVAVGAAGTLLVAAALWAEQPAPKESDRLAAAAKAHDERVKGLLYPGAKRVETQWDQADGAVKQRVLVTGDGVEKVFGWYAKELGHPEPDFGAWKSIQIGDGRGFDYGGAMDASEYGLGADSVKRPVAVRTLVQTKPGYTLSVVFTRADAEKQTVVTLTYTVLEGLESFFEKK